MDAKKIDLAKKKCLPCEGGIDPINKDTASELIKELDNGWVLTADSKKIYKEYRTKNYHEIMSIINMIAFISHKEDHHPEINFTYNTARVVYYTYAIDGLSENDFICAAKVDESLKN